MERVDPVDWAGMRSGNGSGRRHTSYVGSPGVVQLTWDTTLPFESAEYAQADRDLRLDSGPVVQPAVAAEDLECHTAAMPGRLETLDPLELRDSLGQSRAGQ